MTNNYVLRRVRYALDLNDATMLEIFRLSDHEMDRTLLTNILKKEDEPGYIECSKDLMGLFLNGLIVYKRGRKEIKPGETGEPEKKPETGLTNNTILKKLRIALELKENDMLEIMQLAEVNISPHELTALFRKEGHKNYRECGDQFLRNFLHGLTRRLRPDSSKDQ